MAAAISPGAGRRYGVARVCQVWDLPRSSFYAARQPQADTAAPAALARTRSCWQRSGPTSPARHGPGKAIARSGPGCG